MKKFAGIMVATVLAFSLVGCMVSPCFKYEEFELFDRKELLEKYPKHREVILRLTRE